MLHFLDTIDQEGAGVRLGRRMERLAARAMTVPSALFRLAA